MSPAALTAAREWTQGVSSSADEMAHDIYNSCFGEKMIGAAWNTTWFELLKQGSQHTWPVPAYE
jgi:hypothetical protein